ncbi:hypothetical protein DR864_28485 (plasmid) [Runella rosea]|uniref:Uncharacterized protein n=1 Tax=Runella rosea TaxID=2259595 RepID=A0A344TT42_9BACT|nr:hypothetical protein [Runella rosea]AXE21813.1 hypothetical protein DR864_28485 [Runella rosea]
MEKDLDLELAGMLLQYRSILIIADWQDLKEKSNTTRYRLQTSGKLETNKSKSVKIFMISKVFFYTIVLSAESSTKYPQEQGKTLLLVCTVFWRY